MLGWLSTSFDLGRLQGGAESGEDCLFLDLYVPGKALKGHVKLPIINWIYGGENTMLITERTRITNRCGPPGANLFGTKDGIYSGTGIINASNGTVIFVAGNYRVSLTKHGLDLSYLFAAARCIWFLRRRNRRKGRRHT
jgi:hypothetical protein